ncbi:PREDICTED: mavicyanin-like [Populus euphratica]|uniref:Mavicyanin-like n=1 Tax=Populus euphratica TaxID=75702 RepID=A0AAJ6UGV8_POPEU|nr:PREDICTED: mavicyanin-like [Populus euphratica]XP_011029119.1 PREDICTED: mavicyanin-like [Populus euphratica]XP_011029120.1 PREDICTED: mavicyanin-like [Populus euphratica]
MASSGMFMIIAIVAVFLPSILATEHVVGDKTGWRPGFDYKTWAQGKTFYVGDTLVFKYTPGAHNVLRVNGTGFQECKAADDIVPLTTGNDVIPLSTPGKKWYICGVAKHCESGNQKLSITVLPQLGSPATSPSPSPTGTTPSGAAGDIASRYHGLIVAIVGVFGMIMF